MNIEVPIQIGLAGRFRFTVRDAGTMRVKRRTPWMKNLILDQGLNRFATGAICTSVQVGSGNTAPANGQTQLQTYIAGTSAVIGDTNAAQATAPYFSRRTRTWRFNAGQAAGTIAEIGVGWTNTTGNLFSRALVLDANGVPTTITVLSDEVLDITYELRVYPPLIDKVFQRTISGVLHDCVMRAATVTTPANWVGQETNRIWDGLNSNSSSGRVYNGALGPITGSPSGVSDTSDSAGVAAAYVNNSLQRKFTYTYGLTRGNLAGGIVCAVFVSNIGTYQISFSPVIAKDNTKVLTLSWIVSWTRYNP